MKLAWVSNKFSFFLILRLLSSLLFLSSPLQDHWFIIVFIFTTPPPPLISLSLCHFQSISSLLPNFPYLGTSVQFCLTQIKKDLFTLFIVYFPSLFLFISHMSEMSWHWSSFWFILLTMRPSPIQVVAHDKTSPFLKLRNVPLFIDSMATGLFTELD